MKISTLLIIMLVIVFSLSSLATLIYHAVYKAAIRKRLASGIVPSENISRRKLIEPLRFFLISIIILMVLSLCFLAMTSINATSGHRTVERLDDSGIMSGFDSSSDIPGYSREVLSSNGIEIIHYSKTFSSSTFPDDLLYIDIAGDYECSCKFRDSVPYSFAGHSGNWYAMNGDHDGSVEFTVRGGSIDTTLEIDLG